MYDEGNRCAAEQLQKCEAMQMLKLVNSQLEAVCFRIESMFRDYQCMLDTYRQNPKCLEPIRGIVTEEEACKGQQESFDCYTSALSCYQGSLILVREMVRGHGCRVDLKRWLTKPPTTTTTTTSVPTTVGNETIPEAPTSAAPPATESVTTPRNPVALEKKSEKLPKLAIEETAEFIQASNTVTAQPTTVTAPEVPEPLEEPPTTTSTTTPAPWFGTCSPRNRKIARVCMGPLLRTWDGLRKRRLQLRKSQFPIYRYTKTELLELCDGYANSFLCAGHDTIRYCLNDELVSFSQGQLGYQCSPQNLRRFLTHYDCITKVEETSNCRDMVSGEALPSARNTQVCAEIANYTDCMTPLVLKQCQPEGLSEFLRTVLQYGCKNVKLD